MCFTHSEGYLTFGTDSDVFTHFNHQGALIRAFDGQWDLPRSFPVFVDNDYYDIVDLLSLFHYTQSCTLKVINASCAVVNSSALLSTSILRCLECALL